MKGVTVQAVDVLGIDLNVWLRLEYMANDQF